MIKSLVITGLYNISLDANNRVEIDDKKVSIKDIPYVRYKFDKYGDEEVEYIRKSIEKFPYSVHIADIQLVNNAQETCDRLNEIFNSNENGDMNIILFVVINVYGDTVENGCFSDDAVGMIGDIDKDSVHRFIIKDCDQAIVDKSRADKLIKALMSVSHANVSDIAICGSILSGDKGYSKGCLPASVVRDLQTFKSEDIEVPLVPEGHQNCGGCCGCTRYAIVDSDIKVTKSERVSGNSRAKVKGEPGESSEKRAPVRKAIPSYNLFGSDD